MNIRDGQYYYAPHRSVYGIWQNHELGNGRATGTFIKDCLTKEEARKEVYRLNGWDRPNKTQSYEEQNKK